MTNPNKANLVQPTDRTLPAFNYVSEQERANEIRTTLAVARESLGEQRIFDMSADELAAAMSMLQHGAIVGVWQTPAYWAQSHPRTLLRVDLKERVLAELASPLKALLDKPGPNGVPARRLERLVDCAVVTMTRYLLVCRSSSASMRENHALDPSSIAVLAYQALPRLVAIGIQKQFDNPSDTDSGQLFATIGLEDLPPSPKSRQRAMATELKRAVRLHALGVWDDTPRLSSIEKTTPVAGPEHIPEAESRRDSHLPLPDDYVSEMGRKAAWLIENIGPSVIAALNGLAGVWKRAAGVALTSGPLSNAAERFLSSFEWRDANGHPLTALPFEVRMNGRGQRGAEEETGLNAWPPRLAVQVFGLAKLVQTAHVFVVGLSLGARRMELLTLQRNCVAYAKDNERYANGRTFKLVKRHDGEERDWVLPDFAVQALEQQVRLIAAAERLSSVTDLVDPDAIAPGGHMWGLLGGGARSRAEPLSAAQLNVDLVAFASSLGMSTKPAGQRLRSHRFRKTLARLGALAIVEAPKVLLDVFGHKSFEMTLYYILEDKDLRAEIEEIARELRVMRATTVVEEMLAAEEADEAIRHASGDASTPAGAAMGGYGGLAAVSIHRTVVNERAKAHRRGETWGTDNVHDLALVLTTQGGTWQLVRPGVICTKSIGQAGACNRKKGYPEPANCQTLCDYRLEEAWHREDVDGSIADAVRLYVEAGERGEDLAQCLWKDQVLVNLPRFPDLQEKWKQHPVVRSILEGEETSA